MRSSDLLLGLLATSYCCGEIFFIVSAATLAIGDGGECEVTVWLPHFFSGNGSNCALRLQSRTVVGCTTFVVCMGCAFFSALLWWRSRRWRRYALEAAAATTGDRHCDICLSNVVAAPVAVGTIADDEGEPEEQLKKSKVALKTTMCSVGGGRHGRNAGDWYYRVASASSLPRAGASVVSCPSSSRSHYCVAVLAAAAASRYRTASFFLLWSACFLADALAIAVVVAAAGAAGNRPVVTADAHQNLGIRYDNHIVHDNHYYSTNSAAPPRSATASDRFFHSYSSTASESPVAPSLSFFFCFAAAAVQSIGCYLLTVTLFVERRRLLGDSNNLSSLGCFFGTSVSSLDSFCNCCRYPHPTYASEAHCCTLETLLLRASPTAKATWRFHITVLFLLAACLTGHAAHAMFSQQWLSYTSYILLRGGTDNDASSSKSRSDHNIRSHLPNDYYYSYPSYYYKDSYGYHMDNANNNNIHHNQNGNSYSSAKHYYYIMDYVNYRFIHQRYYYDDYNSYYCSLPPSTVAATIIPPRTVNHGIFASSPSPVPYLPTLISASSSISDSSSPVLSTPSYSSSSFFSFSSFSSYDALQHIAVGAHILLRLIGIYLIAMLALRDDVFHQYTDSRNLPTFTALIVGYAFSMIELIPYHALGTILKKSCMIPGLLSAADILLIIKLLSVLSFYIHIKHEYLRSIDNNEFNSIRRIQETFEFAHF